MQKLIPSIQWIKGYNTANLRGDVIAGLTVGVMLIPQGMAYAMLAGLPPIYGLYSSIVPLIVYALFGTSRQLAVGPVAMVSLLVASGVGLIAEGGTSDYIAAAILLAFMVGAIQFLLGAFRLGFLVNLLSHPVIAGFTSGAAILIAVSQLKHLFGIHIETGQLHNSILSIIENIGNTNLPSLAIGLTAIVSIVLLKQLHKTIPTPLIVVILGTLAVYMFNLQDLGVKTIGEVPSGLPIFELPTFSLPAILTLLPLALAISFLSFMESFAVATVIQKKHQDYQVDANQELRALGLANVIGSFFQSYPVTGGFSRSAVNNDAGAKTGLASIISAMIIVVTLLLLTQYFELLPNAVLAAIIMVAVYGLIDIKEAKHLYQSDKLDFYSFIITALSTLFIGIEEGILIGTVFSIGLIMYKISYPHIAKMGLVPDTNEFRNTQRFQSLETFDTLLIIRFDAQIFYANVKSLKTYILDNINEQTEGVILEASVVTNVDSTGVDVLKEIAKILKSKDIKFVITDVKGPVRDVFHRNHIDTDKHNLHFELTTMDAVNLLLENKHSGKENIILQTSEE